MRAATRRLLLRFFAGAFVAVAVFNLLAWRHARAFTRFADSGTRTAAVETIPRWQRLRTLVAGVTLPRPENLFTPASVGLRFDTLAVESDPGLRLELWRVPADGPPAAAVLLCHGYAGCKSGLLDVAADFHRRGLEVWMLDFRGSGGSSGNETSVGWHEARDVAAAVRRIRADRPGLPLVLHGTSMGAVAILGSVAREGVRADALVLECPFNSLADTAGNRFRMLGLPAFPGAPLLAFWGGVQQGFPGLRFRPADDARSVACPTLLFLGEHDQRVTVAQGREVADGLGSHGTTVISPRCGHESVLGCAPEAWAEEVGKLLGNLPERTATMAETDSKAQRARGPRGFAAKPPWSAARRSVSDAAPL